CHCGDGSGLHDSDQAVEFRLQIELRDVLVALAVSAGEVGCLVALDMEEAVVVTDPLQQEVIDALENHGPPSTGIANYCKNVSFAPNREGCRCCRGGARWGQ